MSPPKRLLKSSAELDIPAFWGADNLEPVAESAWMSFEDEVASVVVDPSVKGASGCLRLICRLLKSRREKTVEQ
jgi:hypothetical protein